MMLFLLFCRFSLISSIFTHTTARLYPQDVNTDFIELRNFKKRESESFVPVLGVPGNDIHPRLEVRHMLFKKPNQWTLFVLALQKFQHMSQSDKLSYYQIAAIHGVPRQDWDGVEQCSNCHGADGYCTHDSVLFPAWHRTYLALFEQQFMVIVNELARSYPKSRRAWMVGAASTMRFPFWDWAAQPARGYPALPHIMSDKYITVETPTGTQTIANPLFRHDFQSPKDLVYTPFTDWQVTLRYPDTNSNTASSVTQDSSKAFENIRASLQDQVYQMFSTCRDFAGFANGDSASGSSRCSNSLEGIHNTVHTTLGGPGSSAVSAGHMTYLSLAAFDPGFWLHHMNVDRLFALWQAINPNSYGASQPAPHSTWTIPAGEIQNADSPLTPFHRNSDGDFWTSNQARDWRIFRYTYPEFVDSDGSVGAIERAINRLYGPGATAPAGFSRRTSEPETYDEEIHPKANDIGENTSTTSTCATGLPSTDTPLSAERSTASSHVVTRLDEEATAPTLYPSSFAYGAENGSSPLKPTDVPTRMGISSPLRAGNGSSYQYFCSIETPRYILNGSYSIFVFNGEPHNPDPLSWTFDKNLIGPAGILAQPGMADKNVIVKMGIPLTRTLVYEYTKGNIPDLTADSVDNYLQQKLRWRIVGPRGQEIDSTTIPGFKAQVFAATAAANKPEDVIPRWSEFVPLLRATKGNVPSSRRCFLRQWVMIR